MAGFDWGYVLSLFGDPRIWNAAGLVLVLSTSSWLVGVTFGLGVALLRRNSTRAVRSLSGVYIWFFRNVPLLVLIVFVYNGPLLFPALKPILSEPFWAAFIAIVLTEVAYSAEIFRGGLVSVTADQYDAGRALGLTSRQVFTRVVFPQALRVSMPALRNSLIMITKTTSLASVISLPELLYVGQSIYSMNFKVIETLIVVTVFYIAIVSALDAIMMLVEKRLDVHSRKVSALPLEEDGDPVAEKARQPRVRHPHTGSVVITAKDVKKAFAEQVVLDGIDLTVHQGEVVALIGPSGSGKTTFLRTLNQLEPIDDGIISVSGVEVGVLRLGRRADGRGAHLHRREVGMVFQRFNLFPHLSVTGNLMLAPRMLSSASRSELEERARGLLKSLGLDAHRNKYPHQLSGGQQQRVAIARALMMQPKVLLFDEPTSALDRELVGEVLDTIRALAVQGLTMVVISHELRFVEDVADWVVFMDRGIVIEQGPPEILHSPTHPRMSAFVGRELAGSVARNQGTSNEGTSNE